MFQTMLNQYIVLIYSILKLHFFYLHQWLIMKVMLNILKMKCSIL